jgi:hypothetical protein
MRPWRPAPVIGRFLAFSNVGYFTQAGNLRRCGAHGGKSKAQREELNQEGARPHSRYSPFLLALM